MTVLRHIIALIIKEFLAIMKDPRSRTVVLIPPMLQAIVFGYAATFELNHIPFAVYDQDRSAPSRALVAGFEGSPNFERVATLTHEDQIAQVVNNMDALVVVQVGPQFERDLRRGASPAVQVIVDGRNSNTALIALNYANTVLTRFVKEAQASGWVGGMAQAGAPVELVTRAWYNPNLESQWFIVPGIAGVLTLVVTLLVTSLSVARERENGTFDQLLVTPLRPIEILIGKAAPGIIIGLAEATFIVALAVFWFDVPLRGSLATLYLGLSLFMLSAVGIGLMISSLSATMQQGLLGTFVVVMPAVVLSGFSTPIENMAPWVQYLTYLNPLRYVLIVLRGVFLEGASASLLMHQLWPMAVIGLISLSIASFLFRRRLY
jgi:ABC-2 type transport system permease protein